MRLIDAGELIEKSHGTAFKDGDDRSIVLNIIDKMPIKDNVEMEKMCEELKAHIEYLSRQNRRKVKRMIVKCHSSRPDKKDCPNLPYCLARLTDPTITGCGMPLWEAGIIRREDIMVEHTVRGEADDKT